MPDPDNPNRSQAIGESESRGLELDVSGEILPGWKVIGGYAYTPFAEITRDQSGTEGDLANQGNRLPNAPRHSGSLFTTYEPLSENLRGLKFGAGVVGVGARQGNPGNTYQLPGYASVNLLANYTLKAGKSRVTAQINVDNLLDKTYFESSNNSIASFYGSPRSVLGSIRVEW